MAVHFEISNAKRLRVLQIFGKPVMGGIENQLLFYLQRYDRDAFEVDVACAGDTTGPLQGQYLATSTRLILCRWSRYVIPFIWRLLKLLSQERYDVVHCRLAEVSGSAMLAAKIAGVPVRIASYDHTETPWSNPGVINSLAVRTLQWMTRRWATRIYGVSRAVLDAHYPHWRQRPEQYMVCYNGVDLEQFSKSVDPNEVRRELGLPTDCLVVGHVGSIRQVKNHQTFVEMAETVSKQFQQVYFLLVGNGVLRPQIESEVRRRNLSSRFVFTGVRKDVPRMLAAMDVFVMPSFNEGFGIAAAEAQLSGLPVVASDLPSIREALCPVMHKFCCKPRDSKGIAEKVKLLLEDPRLRSELGREGREYVINKFSIERTVKQLESLYAGQPWNGEQERR